MLNAIRINDERFDMEQNTLAELTDNTIILCRNFDMMSTLAGDIVRAINKKGDYYAYICDDEDIGKAKYDVKLFLQKTIDINGQKITLCLEPAMVYRAKRIEDIWFLDYGWPNNQKSEQIYPLTAFKDAKELWESGLDAVYTQIAIGRYGGYNGEWISDPRKHRAFL